MISPPPSFHSSAEPDGTRAELTTRFLRDAVPMRDQLYRRAARLTGNSFDAEDLLQETMLRAYASFSSFRSGSNLRAWMQQIMMNAWISKYRAAQRRPCEQFTDELTDSQLAVSGGHLPGGIPSAESAALERLFGDEIAAALASLPRNSRVVLQYACIDGLTYREIAELTGVPVATVTSRLHRARRQLHALVAEVACEQGLAPPHSRGGGRAVSVTTDRVRAQPAEHAAQRLQCDGPSREDAEA
jgi:RNA polymerase sigma-70 factor (ECF subfamily)